MIPSFSQKRDSLFISSHLPLTKVKFTQIQENGYQGICFSNPFLSLISKVLVFIADF